jgi:hypothetical protein
VKNANLRNFQKAGPVRDSPDGAEISSFPTGEIRLKAARFIVARQNCGASDILNEAIMRSATKATLFGSAGSILNDSD